MLGSAAPTSVTPEVAEVAGTVRAEARRQYLKIPQGVMAKVTPFSAWEPTEAMTQVVAGTNFFVKVRISAASEPEEFIQLRIFRGLPHTGGEPTLVAMLRDAEAAGPVQYFEAAE